MRDTIGVDVSKATLDAYRLSDRCHARFSNDRLGLKALTDWIGTADLIVFEATGACHRRVEAELSAQGASLTPRSVPGKRDASPRRPAGWPRRTAWAPRCWRG